MKNKELDPSDYYTLRDSRECKHNWKGTPFTEIKCTKCGKIHVNYNEAKR